MKLKELSNGIMIPDAKSQTKIDDEKKAHFNHLWETTFLTIQRKLKKFKIVN